MEEKISIVMTSYNYANYIGEAIDSVINQTYKNWELIIVDDGSTDNSLDVINKYLEKDSRIKLFQHKGGINKGLAESIKLGLEKSDSNWIAFLESDDKYAPECLEERYKILKEKNDIDLLFTDLIMFQDEDKISELLNYFNDLDKLFYKRDESTYIATFKKNILQVNLIPTFSVVVLKKELLKNCDFNSPCRSSLDYYLWAQLSGSRIYYLAKKLTYWRIHKDSYIHQEKYTSLAQYLFKIIIYSKTIRNKNIFLRTILILNDIRVRLVYIKISKDKIKLNLFNGKYIFEKNF